MAAIGYNQGMKKAIFVTSFLLAITLAMLFNLKNNGTEKAVSKENTFISAREAPNKSIAQDKKQLPADLGDYLKIIFLDVGQGDAEFIEWANGEQMLIDCGKDATVLSALGRVMKYYDKEIDYLAVTHPDLDHYGGCIDVLKRFEVKNIIYTGLQKDDKGWNYFWDMIDQEGANYIEIAARETKQIDGATFDFLYPDKSLNQNVQDNNSSLVFKLTYGQNDILFMGDAEEELENYLLEKYKNDLDAEILKVGHHGSGGSSSQNFIDMVSPDWSIISVGKNYYGHPSRRVLNRLIRAGSQILRTDESGDIAFKFGKDAIQLEK